MTKSENQLDLFETDSSDIEKILLYGLGDFQKRGFELIGRKLPLDRLLGAFKRAFENFGANEVSDQQIAESLSNLGARIDEVPSYVAKHPYRVTVFKELADRALVFYEAQNDLNK